MRPKTQDWTASPAGDSPPRIPNYLFPAILSTCCFFGMPFGIISIIYAARVNAKAAAGDLHGAIDASRKAKRWLIIAILVGLLSGVVSGILQLTTGIYGQ